MLCLEQMCCLYLLAGNFLVGKKTKNSWILQTANHFWMQVTPSKAFHENDPKPKANKKPTNQTTKTSLGNTNIKPKC